MSNRPKTSVFPLIEAEEPDQDEPVDERVDEIEEGEDLLFREFPEEYGRVEPPEPEPEPNVEDDPFGLNLLDPVKPREAINAICVDSEALVRFVRARGDADESAIEAAVVRHQCVVLDCWLLKFTSRDQAMYALRIVSQLLLHHMIPLILRNSERSDDDDPETLH